MRVVSCIVLFILSTLVPLPLTVLLFCCYAFIWTDGYELLGIAVCIDAYFGAAFAVPYYTLATTVLLTFVAWMKPRLLVYNTKDA